jgi:FkbM family methyltransferase
MDNRRYVNLNRKIGSKFGWQLKRYVPDLLEARMGLIRKLKPDLIVDGGANRGGWSQEVRYWDKTTPIIAFEPVRESFDVLEKLGLYNLACRNVALSDSSGTASIQVSGPVGMASSIGEANSFYRKLYPNVRVTRTEEVATVTLDSLEELRNKSTYLKLDVEGHEWQVLQGAKKLLSDQRSIIALEIETSIHVTRHGEKTHYQIVPWLETLGFKVFHLATPGTSRQGNMNFIDCILTRQLTQ